jgi:hypothetical protein
LPYNLFSLVRDLPRGREDGPGRVWGARIGNGRYDTDPNGHVGEARPRCLSQLCSSSPSGRANATDMVAPGHDSAALFGLEAGDAVAVEPVGDLGGVEADEPTDAQERHPPLVDKPADVPVGHAEPFGQLVHCHQLG